MEKKIIRNFFWAPLWGTHTGCQFVILPGFSPVQGVLKWKLWQLMSVKIHASSSHIPKTVRSFIDKEKKIWYHKEQWAQTIYKAF